MDKKKNIVLPIFVLILVLLNLIIYIYKQNYSRATAKPVNEEQVYIVKSGDTIWGIAKQNSNGGDIREYVYQIQKLNNVDSIIYPGQRLKLPP